MKKHVLIGAAVVLLVLIVWRFIPIPGTYHFAGEGENFGAGVNTTLGLTSFKDLELVVYSKTFKKINNIEYELKGRLGLKGSGRLSLDDKGYYIGSLVNENSPNNISRFDVILLTLKWDGQKEELRLTDMD